MTTPAPLPVKEEDLPASFTKSGWYVDRPATNFHTFLDSDLSVTRYDSALRHLWMAGRPYPPRALNKQIVLNRELIATEEVSLHLVWTANKIFLKPLPRYMLSKEFYKEYLSPNLPCPYGPALGLLYTYTALVQTELDFQLAKQANLLHENYKWEEWWDLATCVLTDYPSIKIYTYLPGRYVYGELRLSRLGYIYRFVLGNLLYGFSPLTSFTRYSEYFSENIRIFTAATVYLFVVLTAIQVAQGTDILQHNGVFQHASYVIAIASILVPVVATLFMLFLFVLVFFANWGKAVEVRRGRLGDLQIKILRTSSRAEADFKEMKPRITETNER